MMVLLVNFVYHCHPYLFLKPFIIILLVIVIVAQNETAVHVYDMHIAYVRVQYTYMCTCIGYTYNKYRIIIHLK